MEDHEEDNAAMGAMVTAIAWVGRGFAKPLLDSYEPDDAVMSKSKKLATKITKGKQGKEINQVAKDVEMQMEEMDLEDDDEDEVAPPIFTSELAALKAKEMGEDFVDEALDDEDMEEAEGDKDDGPMAEHPDAFDDSEEEKDDYTIRKTDSIIVAATAENDHSNLEVYIYEHEHANLYVHHEIILGSYPLCIEWLPHF